VLPKAIDTLVLDDIERLPADQVSESRTLDFKRDLVGPRDDDKREFLADVSALANTAGGDLVFGIEETAGIATAFRPIAVEDTDSLIRRLEDILRTGLEPRLPSCTLRWVGAPNRGALVIRTPRSWLAPHRVIFRDHAKFYARNSAGKYALDVSELRTAFSASEALTDRIRAFRRERISLISADEGSLPLRAGAKLLLHIVPLSAFTSPANISPSSNGPFFRPLGVGGGFNSLHTLEGFTTFAGPEDSTEGARAFTLCFRNGIVEAVACIGRSNAEGSWIFPYEFEQYLMREVPGFFQSLQRMGVEPPFYLMITLCNVRAHALVVENRFPDRVVRPLRRDLLLLPEALVTDPSPNIEALLRPLFDLTWQAFGYPRSFSFDAQGRYTGDR